MIFYLYFSLMSYVHLLACEEDGRIVPVKDSYATALDLCNLKKSVQASLDNLAEPDEASMGDDGGDGDNELLGEEDMEDFKAAVRAKLAKADDSTHSSEDESEGDDADDMLENIEEMIEQYEATHGDDVADVEDAALARVAVRETLLADAEDTKVDAWIQHQKSETMEDTVHRLEEGVATHALKKGIQVKGREFVHVVESELQVSRLNDEFVLLISLICH